MISREMLADALAKMVVNGEKIDYHFLDILYNFDEESYASWEFYIIDSIESLRSFFKANYGEQIRNEESEFLSKMNVEFWEKFWLLSALTVIDEWDDIALTRLKNEPLEDVSKKVDWEEFFWDSVESVFN